MDRGFIDCAGVGPLQVQSERLQLEEPHAACSVRKDPVQRFRGSPVRRAPIRGPTRKAPTCRRVMQKISLKTAKSDLWMLVRFQNDFRLISGYIQFRIFASLEDVLMSVTHVLITNCQHIMMWMLHYSEMQSVSRTSMLFVFDKNMVVAASKRGAAAFGRHPSFGPYFVNR